MNLRSLAGFAVGPVATVLLSALTIPALAWLFPPEDIGRANILSLAFSLAVLALGLGLDQGFVREYHRTEAKARLFKASILPGLAALACAAVILLGWGGDTARLLFDMADPRLALLLLAGATATYLTRFLSLVLRMQERGYAFSAGQIMAKAIVLLSLPLLWLLEDRWFMHLAIVLVTAAWFAVAWLAWQTRAFLREAAGARIAWQDMAPMLSYGLPLVLSGFGAWALASTGTWLLRIDSSFAELGIYAMALSIGGVAGVAQSIFTTVWSPTVHKWAAQGEDLTRVDIAARHAQALVVLGFSGAGAASFLLPLILPEAYHPAQFLVAAAVGQPLLYALSEVTCVGINLTRKSHLAALAAMLAFLVNAAIGSLLVPSLGARGAVTGLLFGFLAYFVLRTEFSARAWRAFPRRRLYLATSLPVGLATLSALYGEALGRLGLALWLLLGLAGLVLFRQEWREMAGLLKGATRPAAT